MERGVRYLLICAGIFKQSMGPRKRVGIGLSPRLVRLQSLVELVPWNRFFGFLKVKKFGLWIRTQETILQTFRLSAQINAWYRGPTGLVQHIDIVLQTPSKSFRHYSLPMVVWGRMWEVKRMPRICKSSYGGKVFTNIFISINVIVNLNGCRANR